MSIASRSESMMLVAPYGVDRFRNSTAAARLDWLTGTSVVDHGFGLSANSTTVNFVVGPVVARCACISSTTPSKRP